jgi:hypothetical protein
LLLAEYLTLHHHLLRASPASGCPSSGLFARGECLPNFGFDWLHVAGLIGHVVPTLEDVREAEKKIKEILAALRKDDLLNSDDLREDLRRTTEEYAKAVRETEMKA